MNTTIPIFKVAYDGSRYYGSQLQLAAPTVQKSLEKALKGLTIREEPRITFSGRTDRGVHSLGQIFSVKDGLKPPTKAVAKIFNDRLEPYIKIIGFADVPIPFCPRGSATSRVYNYILRLNATSNPFEDAYSTPCEPIDFDKARKVASFFEGIHNFRHLTIKPDQQKQLERLVDKISIDVSKDKKIAIVTCVSKAFLRAQVRNMVNLIILGGQNKLSLEEISSLMTNKVKDCRIKPAPPGGLYLTNIKFDKEHFTAETSIENMSLPLNKPTTNIGFT